MVASLSSIVTLDSTRVEVTLVLLTTLSTSTSGVLESNRYEEFCLVLVHAMSGTGMPEAEQTAVSENTSAMSLNMRLSTGLKVSIGRAGE